VFARPGIQVVLPVNTTARYSDSFKLFGHHPRKKTKKQLPALQERRIYLAFFTQI